MEGTIDWKGRVARHTAELGEILPVLEEARKNYKLARANYRRVENDLIYAKQMRTEQLEAEVRRLRVLKDKVVNERNDLLEATTPCLEGL